MLKGKFGVERELEVQLACNMEELPAGRSGREI